MSDALGPYVDRCVEHLQMNLRRHRLVFVQMGSGHGVARDRILSGLGEATSTMDLLATTALSELARANLIVDDLEALVSARDPGGSRLGALRERVTQMVDDGVNVLLVSRVPKSLYSDTPGSSILNDAISSYLPPVAEESSGAVDTATPGWRLPAVSLGGASWVETLVCVFQEVGAGTLAALDAAMFESHLADGRSLELLRPLDLEALRGAGLLMLDETHSYAYTDTRIGDVRNALAEALSACSTPQEDLKAVAEGLWSIERLIRHKARAAAVSAYGEKWRKQALYGDLPAKVLERARGDAYPAARSVGEIRDPLEWLTLGELLDLVHRSPYDLLGVAAPVWRKLAGDLLPIRNRLSHMRLLRSADRDAVRLWLVQAERVFG